MKKTQKILEQDQIDKIIKRIAYQILENNSEELEIFLIGIKNNGYILAELIYHQLKQLIYSSFFLNQNYVQSFLMDLFCLFELNKV